MSGAHLWKTLDFHFKASPAKSALLGVLALVLLVLVVKLFLRGPRSASAASAPGMASAPPGMSATLPNLGPRSPGVRPAMTSREPRPPAPELPDRLARDLFETDWTLFAPASDGSQPAAEPPAEDRQVPRREAPALTLELTLTGPSDGGPARAVISGRSVRVGDMVGDFVVESISPGQVVLTTERRQRMTLLMR